MLHREGSSAIKAGTIYDAFGRVTKVTKPFTPIVASPDTNLTPAAIDSANAYYASRHPAYYSGPSSKEFDTGSDAYSQIEYYQAPLNRPKKQAAPGTAFRLGTGKEIKFDYLVNAGGEVPGYAANLLMKQRQTDENGNVADTFTDKFGNTVASIVDPTGLNYKTTLHYDVMGNLLSSRAPRATAGDSTKYFYTTLNRLRKKISPDAGPTEYLYDQNGNLRLVKDANGAAGSYFIYYKFDAFNRKSEEGRVNSLASFRQDSANIAAFPATGYTWKVKYHYDVAGYTAGAPQRNLRGRMDAIDRFPNMKGYLFYSYDNNGNLEWLQQFIPKSNINDGNGNLVAMINYSYDALGKVTKMYYRRTFPPGGPSDAFYVWYDYDALGRLEKVFANTIDLKTDSPAAQYTYWPNGLVRRVVLGNNLQGVDYLYNSRDWLTQINHQNLYYTQDPGGDGGGAGVPNPDRFGQVIGYDKQKGLALGHSDFFAQYNGNISWTYHKTFGNTQPVNSGITGWVFRYDKANRLVKANWGHWNNSGGYWQLSRRYDLTGRTAPDSLIEYDANGNLEYMIRFDQNNAATLMDYSYLANSNKLNYVDGLNGQASGNYVYDNNGNMIKDVAKLGASNTISYDYRNLPYKVPKTNGIIDFGYDGKGRRVSKNNLFYVPGADGRVLAVYDDKGTLLYWNIWGLDLIGQRFWASS